MSARDYLRGLIDSGLSVDDIKQLFNEKFGKSGKFYFVGDNAWCGGRNEVFYIDTDTANVDFVSDFAKLETRAYGIDKNTK